jgi:Domain of unknown function (DUF4148)
MKIERFYNECTFNAASVGERLSVEVCIMSKALISVVVLASTLAVSTFTRAQTNEPLTRAQVKAELAELERAGYSFIVGEASRYPDDIRAAEARIAAGNRPLRGNDRALDGSPLPGVPIRR